MPLSVECSSLILSASFSISFSINSFIHDLPRSLQTDRVPTPRWGRAGLKEASYLPDNIIITEQILIIFSRGHKAAAIVWNKINRDARWLSYLLEQMCTTTQKNQHTVLEVFPLFPFLLSSLSMLTLEMKQRFLDSCMHAGSGFLCRRVEQSRSIEDETPVSIIDEEIRYYVNWSIALPFTRGMGIAKTLI